MIESEFTPGDLISPGKIDTEFTDECTKATIDFLVVSQRLVAINDQKIAIHTLDFKDGNCVDCHPWETIKEV